MIIIIRNDDNIISKLGQSKTRLMDIEDRHLPILV